MWLCNFFCTRTVRNSIPAQIIERSKAEIGKN